MKARLKFAEKNLLPTQRHCRGDASETGLVQFVQAIQDIDDTRNSHRTHIYENSNGKSTECIIPFSSDIKFNVFIREMSGQTADGTSSDLSLFMKGTPERILNRCSKILINGKEVDFTEELKDEVEQANKDIGALGERVLAFARYTLPSDKYSKDYKFDVSKWKDWGFIANSSADYES
jgi:sodium/potassium-transporting ATPase subunit alpha